MPKGHITIDESLCKGCELCISVCPYNLLQLADHYTWQGYQPTTLHDPDQRCTGCMLCAIICPDAAITVFRAVKRTTTRAKSFL
jgi:2-oxoglutarate ferredoxin oxidoreductase subunit delta